MAGADWASYHGRMKSHPFSAARPFRFLPFCLLAWASVAVAADWPEFRGPDRAGVWETAGVIDTFEGLANPLPRVWTTPVGAGYSGPTVAGRGVYLMDRGVPGATEEVERIVCVDRATGAPRWAHSYACLYRDVDYAHGPRGSVTIREGRAYALGMMGHLHCLDAETGKVIWAKDLAAEYRIQMPIWGLSSSPLVEGGVLVVQVSAPEDKACFVGFDRETGAEKWRAFADRGSYVSPIMIEQAGRRVLVAWTGQRIAGMDPATGAVHWEIPTPPSKMPINVPGPALNEDGTLLFLSVFYDGARLIELSQTGLTARERWHRQGINERTTDALHAMISPPYFAGGHVYGIDSYGQMRCLDPATGERLWENLDAIPQGRWGTGFMVPQGDRTWIVTERGDLILSRLTPDGYTEIGRARLIEPTTPLKQRPEGTVLWSYPAFAGTHVFARNDRELICVDLAK
jgi:outer membrane protein assembly factor BamB